MHIPDGLVSEHINALSAVASTGVVGYALWRLCRSASRPAFDALNFATVSAFIFAAQMLNFSIGGGTSGHFLGAMLAAALLGPWAACLSLSLVLAVQSIFFGDGGIMALGTNVMNMGIVGGVLAYPVYIKACRHMPKVVALAVASWGSLVASSAFCSLELALSGASPLSVVLPAMVGTHALIGLGEAVITVAALAALEGLMNQQRRMAFAGLLLALALATFVSPFASSAPDGLEKVAEDQGFLSVVSEEVPALRAGLMPDYQVPAIQNTAVSTGLAGFVGSLLVFGFAMAPSRLLRRE